MLMVYHYREIQQVVVKSDIPEFRRVVWTGAAEIEIFSVLVTF